MEDRNIRKQNKFYQLLIMEIQNHNDPQIIFVHFILAISFGCLVLIGLKKSIEIPQKCFLFVKTGIKCDIKVQI